MKTGRKRLLRWRGRCANTCWTCALPIIFWFSKLRPGARSQIVEEIRQITVVRYGLRHLKKRLGARRRGLRSSFYRDIRHFYENSTGSAVAQ